MNKLEMVDQLEKAGILDRSDFTATELHKINELTQAEVGFLIRLRKDHGPALGDSEQKRPNIIV